MANETTPLDAFEIASGLSVFELRTMLAIIFIAGLLFAYVWAIKKGYSGLFKGGVQGDIFEYMKLVLKGATILIVVIIFFVY